jgi:pimeloyl-ACP methyl ester carboxylesterase
MPRAGAITAAAALGALAAAAAAETVAGRRPVPSRVTEHIDGGGYRIAVTDRSSQPTPDAPAVVVVTGAGDCQASWAAVAERLADRTRVITYDRAGLGWSAQGPAPTADRYVTELQAVLDARLPEGPYVLVGHSLGGLVARLHAQQHPSGWPAWSRSTPPRSRSPTIPESRSASRSPGCSHPLSRPWHRSVSCGCCCAFGPFRSTPSSAPSRPN